MSDTIVTSNSLVQKNEVKEETIPVSDSSVKEEVMETDSENIDNVVSTCKLDNAGGFPAESNNRSGANGEATSVVNDSLFEPSLEMMVNDFDDERTLEEEEALAATETDDPNAELDNLQRVTEYTVLSNFLSMHTGSI